MDRDSAETVALAALAWLAEDADMLGVFLGATGAGPSDLRERTGDPEFLASVLDFLLMDESWVIGFCDASNTPYAAPIAARAALPGGEAYHWT